MNYWKLKPTMVEKKWGHELCVVTKKVPGACGYSGKILSIEHGWQCSVHYHKKKTETFFVIDGQLMLELYEPKAGGLTPLKNLDMDNIQLTLSALLKPTEGITLDAMTPHRFWAVSKEGCRFIEFSTPDDPEDSYRITESGRRDDEQ